MSSNANWMSQMASTIGPLPLNQVVYPGSHDSCTYGITKHADFSPDAPGIVEKVKNIPFIGGAVKEVVAGWARAQGNDTTTQLNDGIRYFDLRVCYNAADQDLWIVHAMYSVKLDDVLNAFQTFINTPGNEKEILLLDFNHFYEMTDTLHAQLAAKLKSLYGTKLIPSSQTVHASLDTVWSAGQQVMVCYHNDTISGNNPEFWPGSTIDSPYDDTASTDDLHTFLLNNLKAGGNPNAMYVTQCILTEDATVVIEGFLKSPSNLEEYAADLNPTVISWLQGPFKLPALNIVIINWYQDTGQYLDTIKSLNTYKASLS